MGKKIPDYWEASGKLLADPTIFLDSLLNFDKDNIPDAVIEKIEPFIEMEAFTPTQVGFNFSPYLLTFKLYNVHNI